MKTNSSNLEISSIDEDLSKLRDSNLVLKKRTSAGLDSLRILTQEPIVDPLYFSISDRDKNLSEQLMDDSRGILEPSQIKAVLSPLTNNSSQFFDKSTIPSIPTDCNTPQLPSIVNKPSTNQTNRTATYCNEKLKSPVLTKKNNSLYECLNGVKKLNNQIKGFKKMLHFCKMN